ncbi:MAG: hypothetical protein ACREPR_05095 [Brasilonema sp.]
MLRKPWKPKAAMLSLAVLGGITFSVLTNITVLAQTPSDSSANSQSSANDAGHRRNKVRSDRNDDTSIAAPDHTIVNGNGNFNQSGTAYVEKATSSYTNKKPPIACRNRAIRTVFGWKCPKAR